MSKRPCPPLFQGLRQNKAVQTDALRDVIIERARQKDTEGWTPEHDDQHTESELAAAAVCYARQHGPLYVAFGDGRVPDDWPWHEDWWKPTEPRRDLVKAAALILAEIERLDRAPARAGAK